MGSDLCKMGCFLILRLVTFKQLVDRRRRRHCGCLKPLKSRLDATADDGLGWPGRKVSKFRRSPPLFGAEAGEASKVGKVIGQ